jgi:hypothetical protein
VRKIEISAAAVAKTQNARNGGRRINISIRCHDTHQVAEIVVLSIVYAQKLSPIARLPTRTSSGSALGAAASRARRVNASAP